MFYRKGERTDTHREAEFPFAVDIPIPRDGLRESIAPTSSEWLVFSQWFRRSRAPFG
jgi:hypothetical protein